MPFKSEAQRRKFAELVKKGELSQETFNEWNANTPKGIPDRVKKKQSPKAPLTKIKTVKVLK